MGDTTLRLVVATIIGLMLIVASILGNPGSILGSLIDADHMADGPPIGGGGSVGTF